MSRAPQRIGALGLLLAGAAVGAVSCAEVLGVSDYENAADKACGCVDPQSTEACADFVEGRLAILSTDEVSRWVRYVARGDCSCSGCLDREPICRQHGEDCSLSEGCCGSTGGGTTCGNVNGVSGRACRETCMNCSDLFLLAEGKEVPEADMCILPGFYFLRIKACLCTTCPTCAGSLACEGKAQPSAACAACLKATFASEPACLGKDDKQSCIDDRPVP